MTNERVRFTFRLPAPLLKKIKNRASIEGSSMNSLILHILWDYIQEVESEEAKKHE
ncbi:arc-like DNA binding domain protein [Clostridioides difficile CD149]|uniref:Arc family DNA-binding protein n=1 Tax=Clostridioides difficile TaxID=1496 RepID=UPI00038CA9E5|nr:Arc family DNA-binding protein [Clostridioides difficile]EGT3655797.1 Arc family DNA-binding protein [Clostridioides difficile]EGT3697504.1 Arc family DNA-binding protein [Clostridioides difficile]EGT3904153.1 Arc family DNA-binding protein [Clostridioides difficile]EGT3963963.1 Arc family DNA-binding protein [Clostridioides difficile]EGT4229330.1 Arc family DNA-binding protein [Clostridioides difficile]